MPPIIEPTTAYLQYTSGRRVGRPGSWSRTGTLLTNFEQVMSDYFEDYGKVAPPDTTVVSWVPLSHNMGLFIGCVRTDSGGTPHRAHESDVVHTTARPGGCSCWPTTLDRSRRHRTSRSNWRCRRRRTRTWPGCDLGDVLAIIWAANGYRPRRCSASRSGSPASIFPARRFDRPMDSRRRPCTWRPARRVTRRKSCTSNPEKLSAGQAERCTKRSGTALVSYGVPRAPTVRIVDPETGDGVCGRNDRRDLGARRQRRDGLLGEAGGDRARRSVPGLWRLGDTTEGPWLRTGDLGVISEGELFIMGRIKDLLIVYGRNHYPDDIESTIQEITGGRAAAIAVPDDEPRNSSP